MKKIIEISGMNCSKCQARIENALNSLEGVKSVKTDLKKKTATLTTELSDEILAKAVVDAGYTVLSITEKKGLFK